MKAVIYARYSSDNQREESIDGQIRECTAFAEKNGITILRHYCCPGNRLLYGMLLCDTPRGISADGRF